MARRIAHASLMVLALLGVLAGSASAGDLYMPYETNHLLLLINRNHKIAYDYVPEGLSLPQVQIAPGKDEKAIRLREEAARALEDLFVTAAFEGGHTLYAVSGYRSYALQKSIYTRKVEAVGEKRAQLTVAPPGTSEHQLGLAIDINGEATVGSGLTEAFGESAEGQWVYANAHRFGFIVRYPQDKTDITGYAWEPWHLRYVGEEVATEVFTLDVTFEEYHALMQQRQIEAWLLSGRGDEMQ